MTHQLTKHWAWLIECMIRFGLAGSIMDGKRSHSLKSR